MDTALSVFAPTLRPMAEQINADLRYVCFFVLTTSIIVRATRAKGDLTEAVQPVVMAAVICGLIALLPTLFNAVRDECWNLAATVRSQFTESPAEMGSQLMKLMAPADDGSNPFDIGHSIMKAVMAGIGWLIVGIGSIIQLPLLIGQYVMECLCYMFLPIALSLFALDSAKGIGMRYVQQTLAVLAWPVGFAVVDLVGYSLLMSATSGVSALALGIGAATKFTPVTLILGLIVAIWMILGSLAVPFVMQMLFCSGVPLSSLVDKVAGGVAALALARFLGRPPKPSSDTPPEGSSGPGPSGPSGSPPPPPTVIFTTSPWLPALMGGVERAALTYPTPPSPSSPGPGSAPGGPKALMPPEGHTQPEPQPTPPDPRNDPNGDRFAANIRDLNQIALPVSY